MKLLKLKEDFEFYKDKSGKITVDKVISGASKSGKAFRGSPNSSGDTSNAVKRIPFSKMSQEDKALAKAAYKTLKANGSIENVDKKYKTSPRPDVVLKSDGSHADIYYDDNKDGQPDEKDVRLAASRRRTMYQRRHGLRESDSSFEFDLHKDIKNLDYVFTSAGFDFEGLDQTAFLIEDGFEGWTFELISLKNPRSYTVDVQFYNDENYDNIIVFGDDGEELITFAIKHNAPTHEVVNKIQAAINGNKNYIMSETDSNSRLSRLTVSQLIDKIYQLCDSADSYRMDHDNDDVETFYEKLNRFTTAIGSEGENLSQDLIDGLRPMIEDLLKWGKTKAKGYAARLAKLLDALEAKI